jgi:hypothetical protein
VSFTATLQATESISLFADDPRKLIDNDEAAHREYLMTLSAAMEADKFPWLQDSAADRCLNAKPFLLSADSKAVRQRP